MPTITVKSEVTRQAIQEKIETLGVMDELTSESDLTESDVREIADKINESDASALTKDRRSTTDEAGHRRQRRHLRPHR